jgi:hypothetical protein
LQTAHRSVRFPVSRKRVFVVNRAYLSPPGRLFRSRKPSPVKAPCSGANRSSFCLLTLFAEHPRRSSCCSMRRPPTRRLPGSYADVFRTLIPRRLRDLLDEGADTGSRCIGRRKGRKHKHVARRQARSSRVWAIGVGMTRIALEPHRSEPEMSVDGVDVRKLPAERLRHRHDLFRVVIEEHETRLRHRDKRAICRPRDAEDDVAAILVKSMMPTSKHSWSRA